MNGMAESSGKAQVSPSVVGVIVVLAIIAIGLVGRQFLKPEPAPSVQEPTPEMMKQMGKQMGK